MTIEGEASGEQPPREREFQAERERDEGIAAEEGVPPRDEDVVEHETEAAAGEAARIGGQVEPETEDESERAVLEAGGGEAEGFEEAEAELVEGAEHGYERDPTADEYEVADEAKRETAAYGEADEVHPSEVEDSDR